MPCKSEIDPVEIPDLLPWLSLLETGRCPLRVRYRLAGSRLRDIYGIELTNLEFFNLDLGPKRDYWQAAYGKVINERIPMQGALKGPVVSRDHIILFWLRLPLSDDGDAVHHILCHDMAIPVNVAAENEPLALIS